jgi:hypothetical protein
MCLTPQKPEEIKQDQFSDKGYSGRNDVWISAPDPSAERVYEGTAEPIATKLRRFYLGSRFAEANAAAQANDPLSIARRGIGGAMGFMSPAGTGGGARNTFNNPLAPPTQRLQQKPQPRAQFEIVLENGYDDPDIPNLTGDFYTNWAKGQVSGFNDRADKNALPTADQLVKAEAEAAAAAAKQRPASMGDVFARSMKTKESRYKDLNMTQRDGVTNYVARV